MNQIKAGALLNYVIIALNTLLGLVYTPYMLRMLGQSEYGIYSLVASIIAYLTVLDFGFGNAVVRYTAKFRSEGKQRRQWEMFGMFLTVYCVIGLLALGAGLLLYDNVESMFDHTMNADEIAQAKTMMLLLVVNLVLTFPFSMFGSIITAYEHFVFQKVVIISRLLLSTGLIVVLLYFGYKAVALVVVHTVFNIAMLLLNYFYCRYKLKIRVVFAKFNWPFMREIAVYSFWLFLNQIMDRIYWSTGQFVLGAVVGPVAVAIFSVAILLQQIYMSFSTSICNLLLPRLTAMVAKGNDHHEISELFIRTGRLQCIVMATVLSGFIVFGQGFIDIWAGRDYSLAYVITLIFFGALFVPLMQNTGITILQARNQMKFRSLLYITISVVSLGFQVLLAKWMGAVGCALAIGGALILGQGIIMNIYYHRVQHIDILRFWRQILRMLFIPAALTAAGLASWIWIDYSEPVNLCAGIVVYLLLFTPLFWRWGLNDYERSLAPARVRRIMNLISVSS